MKLIVCALAFVAISTGCTGQQTTTFVPKSACGISAHYCYTTQAAAMTAKMDVLDFASGCQIFKSILVCMDNSGTCTSDFDFRVVRQGLLNDQDGVCGVDGSVQSCGLDVQVCFKEMDAAVSDALSKNFSQACPLIAKFAACANQASIINECSPNLVTKLKQVKQMLGTDQQLLGCNGPCAQAISICTANATTLPVNGSLTPTNIATFCRSSLNVYNCLNGQAVSNACASSPEAHLKDIAQNQLTKIGDICNQDGTTAACVTSLSQCTSDFNGVAGTTNVTVHCREASEFLECISKLPCTSSLAPMVASFRNQIETAEIEEKCPSVGSCNDRYFKCGQQDEGIGNLDTTTLCKKARTGVACFDYVMNDPYCINERNSYISEEQDLKRLIIIKCPGQQAAGSTVTSILQHTTGHGEALRFIQPLLLVAALLASLLQE